MGALLLSRRVVDINAGQCVERYVELRNRYAELLLSEPVEMEATRQWLRRTDAIVRGLADDAGELLGVVILYPSRGNEVAFFAAETGRGMGGELLELADRLAREHEVSRLWAWVRQDNQPARGAFAKHGYRETSAQERTYRGQPVHGIIYER